MSKNPEKILVIRLSALGDVAMVIPVLYPICLSNTHKKFTIITSPLAAELFIDLPKNLEVIKIDTKREYKGIKGIFSLFKCLRKQKYSAVADLHDVLRSKILSLLFRLVGVKVVAIDKGRAEKRAITADNKTFFKQLKTSFERYAEVFEKLGLKSNQKFKPFEAPSQLPDFIKTPNEKLISIGVAPISKHQGKNYPLQKMKEVVDYLVKSGKYRVFLFGSPLDGDILDGWQDKEGRVVSLCNCKLGFKKEMSVIKTLSLMVSMDSANMHIASLMGVPTISIWGATHPYTGFLGWGLTKDSVVEREDLPCRPCSVFGNKPCRLGDYPCLNIDVDYIVNRIENHIKEV